MNTCRPVPRRSLRGSSLVELLVGMVVLGVLAGGLLRMVVGDIRFAENREAWRTARMAARSGLVVLTSDLRMVETGGGLEAAAPGGQDITVRVPYSLGVLCSTTGTSSVVSLLPADSAMFFQPGHSGFAWRDEASGVYSYVPGGSFAVGVSSSSCAASGITILPGARVVGVGGTIPATVPAGTIILLYRRIRYQIGPSTVLPGEVALWRTLLSGGLPEEIGAPFLAASRFRFYQAGSALAQSSVPSPLSNVLGLELAFGGRSQWTPRGAPGPKAVPIVTSVFFHNHTP